MYYYGYIRVQRHLWPSFVYTLPAEMVQKSEQKRILVTGGSGLVGEAVRWVIENESDPRFGARKNESWIFLSSKEGDLR